MAVKETLVPVQMVVLDAAMLTDGVTDVVTVIVISLEVAVVGLAQRSLLVSIQVILSPFTNDEF